MVENLIFLDFDGVINNNIDKVTMEAIETLKKLVSMFNAKIVVISSLLCGGEAIKRKGIELYLNKLGFVDIDFIDPNFEGYYLNKRIHARVLGIIDYLKNHPDSSYIILDDEFHTHYQRFGLNYYKTNGSKGLQKKDIDRIIFRKTSGRIYNHIEYQYRKLCDREIATNNLIQTLKLIKNKNE